MHIKKNSKLAKRWNPKGKAAKKTYQPVADWEAEVSVIKDGKNNLTYRRKVQTRGIVQSEAGDALAKIAEALRQGYEVRLLDCEGNDAIRFFPCLDAKYENMYVAAQTMGNFRKYIEGVPFHMEHCGEIVNPEEEYAAKEKKRAERNENRRLAVTPDTMVTCPSCGTEFRVGKSLN